MSFASEVLADSPLFFYRMQDTSGTQCTDATANARHGTYIGGVTLEQPSLSWQDAATDKSVHLNGIDAYIAVPSFAITGSALSLLATFKLDGELSPLDTLFRLTYGSINTGLALRGESGTNMIRFFGGTFSPIAKTLNISSRIHIIHMIYTATHATIYLDGQVIYDGYNYDNFIATTFSSAQIGQFSFVSTTYAKMFVDEVAAFDGALAPARVAAHYAEFVRLDPTRDVTHLVRQRARRSFQQPVRHIGI